MNRRLLLQNLSLCAVPAAAVLPLRLLARSADPSRDNLAFDLERFRETVKRPAEVCLIGNSMIYRRTDRRVLRRLFSPLKHMELYAGGSRSPQWFLFLKNFAAKASPPPKLVVIVFRDYNLSNLKDKVTEANLTLFRMLAAPEDLPLLDLLKTDSPVHSFLHRTFVPESANARVRQRINDFAYDAAAATGERDLEIKKHVDALFDLENLRADIPDSDAADVELAHPEPLRFTTDPSSTLLPRFVEVARAINAKLVFYRVKRRPDANDLRQDDPHTATYIHEFKNWAESQGCGFVDETPDPRITLSMFHDGDHFSKKGMKDNAPLFYERLKPFLPQPF